MFINGTAMRPIYELRDCVFRMELQKQDFSSIYNHVSPDLYIESLGKYNYRQPDSIYMSLLSKVEATLHEKGICQVVDVACSYGFNGRIVKDGLPYEKFLQVDGFNRVGNTSVIGIDIAPNALTYALENDYIDVKICQNLEKEPLSLEYHEILRKTDLVVASGAFSYVGVPTFQKIYSLVGMKADFIGWPACSYKKESLLEFLRSNFHDVEILSTPLPMRKFTSEQEKQSFHSATKKHNPELYGQFEDHFCVFQIMASRRK